MMPFSFTDQPDDLFPIFDVLRSCFFSGRSHRWESQSGARREVEFIGTSSRFRFETVSVVGLFPLTG